MYRLHKILQCNISQTVTMSFTEIDFDKNLVLSVKAGTKAQVIATLQAAGYLEVHRDLDDINLTTSFEVQKGREIKWGPSLKSESIKSRSADPNEKYVL